jgi:hypothetical protein
VRFVVVVSGGVNDLILDAYVLETYLLSLIGCWCHDPSVFCVYKFLDFGYFEVQLSEDAVL